MESRPLPWSIPLASECRPTVIAIPSHPEALGLGHTRGRGGHPMTGIGGCASLSQAQDAPEAPGGPWGRPESFWIEPPAGLSTHSRPPALRESRHHGLARRLVPVRRQLSGNLVNQRDKSHLSARAGNGRFRWRQWRGRWLECGSTQCRHVTAAVADGAAARLIIVRFRPARHRDPDFDAIAGRRGD